MRKHWLYTLAAGVLMFLLLCGMIFGGRSAVCGYFELRSRESAQDVLFTCQQTILLQMKYEWNKARELSGQVHTYDIVSETGIINHFEWHAEKALAGLGAPARAGLIDKSTVRAILPAEYSERAGKSMWELPYVFNMAKLVGGVAEGPGDYFGDGWKSFLFLHPVLTEEGEYWGTVFLCVDAEAVLSSLKLDTLVERGYEYELWNMDFQDGAKVVVASSGGVTDFSGGERVEFELPGKWTMTLMPSEGWISTSESTIINVATVLLILLALGMVILVMRVVLTYWERRLLAFVDRESGLYNRKGLERQMTRWILGRQQPFALIYFVVDSFNSAAQLADIHSKESYLNEVRRALHDGIQSEHLLGRVGEGNFCAVIRDDMTDAALEDLARSLAMGLIWKTRTSDRKEFLNVGYQFVRYPQDGGKAGALLDKAIQDYFTRVDRESPVVSLTEKCRQLLEGQENIEFEEYSDTYLLRLSKTINQYRKQVEQLAYRDSVYHIGNRSKYTRDARMLISYDKKRPFTLYCVDIRSFSRYNELFSVETGDRILHVIIERLSGMFGDYLYRINGDVFLGILLGPPQVDEAMEKLSDCITAPVHIGTLLLTLEACYGVCAYPQHSRTPEDLLECVQAALGFAKRHGSKKAVVYDEALTTVLRQEGHVLELLEKSLTEKTLEVWYQPILDIHAKQFCVAEALIRLKNEEGEYLSAAQVIEIAEKNRIVDRIGIYVLKEAMRFMAAHAGRTGLNRICVNLSVQELLLEGRVDNILEMVRQYGIAPQMISLEITETVLIQSFDKVCSTLRQLREAGFHIILDDFGTGYSSLNYFSNLPIDVLKIDRSLTHSVVDSKKQFVMLKTIVEMARVNDIRVVAEGVETEEELKVIEEIGVDYIQGFLYSKPLPEEELLEWYRQDI